jgi:predicted DNA repair protein MutK
LSIGLIALFDDIAAIAKVAAASLDDVMAQAAKAGLKAAGVVIDDAAVTPRYMLGFEAERELPIVGKIAAGSLRNKLLLLLPATLALSYFFPWLIEPLLMFGGAYLSYEGTEKVLEAIIPYRAHAHEAQLGTVAWNSHTLEDEKVASAIKTDFILSAEIMAITLAAVPDGSIVMQALVLALVGIGITVAVYGVVALIVKADDVGVALAKNDGGMIMSRAFGRALVLGMPGFLTFLGAAGTAAMIWVGGGIIVHGLEAYGVHSVGQAIDSAAEAAAQALPSAAGPVKWTVIGDRWTVNRRGVDPSSWICPRTRLETVEGYFVQAPSMSLRLQSTYKNAQTKCPVMMLWTAPPPGARVLWIWGLLGLPRSGGATHGKRSRQIPQRSSTSSCLGSGRGSAPGAWRLDEERLFAGVIMYANQSVRLRPTSLLSSSIRGQKAASRNSRYGLGKARTRLA